MSRTLACTIGFVTAAVVVVSPGSVTAGGIMIENAFPNLTFQFPTEIKDPGDGTNRLFVVEKQGRILVFENDPDVTTATEFIELVGLNTGEEGGIVGLAFHPDYANNGHFYVAYSQNGPLRSIIARWTVSESDPNVAEPSTQQILLEIPQPIANHNTHHLEFGPDGYLYIASGDGRCCGDPLMNAQDRTDLRGSLLRIDVDNPQNGLNYGIPPDNPYAGNKLGYREEIFAYGLRNPWRFSFDSTGRIWLGDVGQNLWEEVDWIVSGGNYGWPIREGMHCFDPPTNCDTTGLIEPIWEFLQVTDGAIIGGYVYEGGSSCPSLCGKYICADFVNEDVFALSFDESGLTGAETIVDASGVKTSGFGKDSSDELYGLSYSIFGFVYKLTCDDVSADLNCDGVVGFADLTGLLGSWGPCADCDDCPADLDGNCAVGFTDLTMLLAAWT